MRRSCKSVSLAHCSSLPSRRVQGLHRATANMLRDSRSAIPDTKSASQTTSSKYQWRRHIDEALALQLTSVSARARDV